jgi:hypothetical protein
LKDICARYKVTCPLRLPSTTKHGCVSQPAESIGIDQRAEEANLIAERQAKEAVKAIGKIDLAFKF